MKYIITEFDIFNAITCVGQENKLLWDNANCYDIEEETRLKYEVEILNKIKKYLKKEHNLNELNLTDDNIFYVWIDYYYDLCNLINNYK